MCVFKSTSVCSSGKHLTVTHFDPRGQGLAGKILKLHHLTEKTRGMLMQSFLQILQNIPQKTHPPTQQVEVSNIYQFSSH